jgi:hypothetical protein
MVDWAGLEPAILSEYGPEPYAYAIPPPVHDENTQEDIGKNTILYNSGTE